MGKVALFTDAGLCEPEEENAPDPGHDREQCNQQVRDVAAIIRLRCLQYAEEEAYPLCEFLDNSNVENYVNWLLYNR